jgi:hypothetical protein
VHTREDGPEWQRLTRTGMVLGTPLYMSPEQARGGEDVDARADVWAVGVLLYECLTGEVPFRAHNYLGVISQVLTEEAAPPSRLRPELGIPAGVETVVMRALQKDRDRRYQQMAELEQDLERLLAGDHNVGVPAAAAVVPARPALKQRWHLGVGAVLVIGAGIAVALARTEELGPPPAPAATRIQVLNPALPPPVPTPAPPHVVDASPPPAHPTPAHKPPRKLHAPEKPGAADRSRLKMLGADGVIPAQPESPAKPNP